LPQLAAEFGDLAVLQGLGVLTVQMIQLQERSKYSALHIVQFKRAKDAIPVFDMKATLAVHHQSQIAFGRNAGTATDKSQ
jgi:hypothetical protein